MAMKQSSALKPLVPFIDGSVFSPEAVNHEWGVWPIIIISVLGLLAEVASITRNAVTRDDVWLTKNSKSPCDIIETRKDYPAPFRKYKMVHPKKVPEGLIKAIQGEVEGPSDGNNQSKMSAVEVAAHVAASASILYLALAL